MSSTFDNSCSVTSAVKMAADFCAEENDEVISEILSALDPEMRDILSSVGRANRCELMDKLVRSADMKVLSKTRDSVFRAAMDKVDLCLSQVAKARDHNTCSFTTAEEAMIEKSEQLLKCLTPDDMTQRRCIKKLSGDIVDLMNFAGGKEEKFPAKMLRHVSTFIHKTNSQDSSISEALAFLQHAAGLSQECFGPTIDLFESGHEKVGVNSGECSDLAISRATYGGNDEGVMADTDGHQVHLEMPGNTDNTSDLVGTVTEKRDDLEQAQCSLLHTDGESDNDNQCENGVGFASGSPTPTVMNVAPGESPSMEQGSPHDSVIRAHFGHETEISVCDPEDGHISETSSVSNAISPSTISGQTNKVSMSDHDISNPTGLPQGIISEHEASVGRCAHANEPPSAPTPVTIGLNIDEKSAAARESVCHANSFATYTCSEPELNQSKQTPESERVGASSRRDVPLPAHCTESFPNFPKITISIAFGDFSAVLDIADYVKMAGRSDRDKSRMNDMAHVQTKQRDECRRCDARMDAQDRRIDVLEDAIAERMRRMTVQRGDSAQDTEPTRRRVSVTDSRPGGLAPAIPDAYAQRPPRLQGGVLEPAKDKRTRNLGDVSSRCRADTFSGVPSRSECRTRSEYNSRNQRAIPPDVLSANADAPKPQRTRAAKVPSERPRRGNDGQTKPRDNPIRDWLSTAKLDERDPTTTPAPPQRRRATETSPSWADEPLNDEDDAASSESMTPTPTDRRNDDGTSPASTLSPVSANANRYDDGEYIPPSGQVTTQRNRRTEAPTHGDVQGGAHGGARPKTRGKANAMGNKVNNVVNAKGKARNSDNRKQSAKSGNEKGSYASAVATTQWKTMQSKKRKFEKVSPKLTFPLKGRPTTCNRDVYLQGLDVGDGDGSDDMMESVRSFCVDNGITPVYIRIIPVRYDSTRVGCRLTVREEDFECVMDEFFWPEDVSVREWTPRPRDNRGNGDAGARPPSDNED